MTSELTPSPAPVDPGLYVLVSMLRVHGIGADPEQIRHRCGTPSIGVVEILRCAREFGLKARAASSKWRRLAATPLPTMALLNVAMAR